MNRILFYLLIITCFFSAQGLYADEFRSDFPDTTRTWVGEDYWANRLQDWRINDGRLECLTSATNRNVSLLTTQLNDQNAGFELSVEMGNLVNPQRFPIGWAGFRVGVQGPFGDYRDNAVFGFGLNAGLQTDGRVFIGPIYSENSINTFDAVNLQLLVEPDGEQFAATLIATDKDNNTVSVVVDDIPADQLKGNIALVCSKVNLQDRQNYGNIRFWFDNIHVSGDKITHTPEHAFGPILFAMHTLSDDIMKMTAQLPPVGPDDGQEVGLSIKNEDGEWEQVAVSDIDEMARTATFRLVNWNSDEDVPYRLSFQTIQGDGQLKESYYEGTVRNDPKDKETVVVAGFTGNNDYGFPNNDIVDALYTHEPDVLVFTGDQIYEAVAGFGVQRSPIDQAALDYLRKWYLLGWSFGELMKDRPTLCLPDDHDVYHGNIWGMGGKKAEGEGKPGQDSGGYKMPAKWVNMVQTTQTAHLPDPFDPTPVKQGITVYYTNMNYGGISFGIIEDRKFKSSPSVLLPEANVVNGWPLNPEFDPATESDVAGAVLLGDRQLDFLNHWVADWDKDVWMKTLVSQTIFANVATLPEEAMDDEVVPELRLLQPGAYAEGDAKAADMDSNGWPQTPRDEALRIIRKAFAFHLAGDQHLASTTQYGVDEWGDAPYAFCVPAVANVWPRRWFPPEQGENRIPGLPKYTGDFVDGLGNLVSVFAVSNPVYTGKEPAILHDRATGYGIIKFTKSNRSITMECWPRYADPTDPSTGGQYEGWPITINQMDNYNRQAKAYLPTIQVSGMENPVIQVFDENDELVYSIRIDGTEFTPKVFEDGEFKVIVGEPSEDMVKVLENLSASNDDDGDVVEVVF